MFHITMFSRFVRYVLLSTDSPVLAQLVVTRRCNLHCAYCNEYDNTSEPISLEVLKQRIAALASLKTLIVACTGGEPLLHPDLAQLIKEIRRHGMQATLITNGYLLTQPWIEELNEAGLQSLQISIDNIIPDDVSVKSLKILDKKLQLLADHARFKVNINSVMGISDERARDVVEVAERAVHYGFSHTVGIMHDGSGTLRPLNETQHAAYQAVRRLPGAFVDRVHFFLFQKNLIDGRPNHWKCRAGARYLYICEDGLVHWCSQQRGYPGVPLAAYAVEDIRREYKTRKGCSPFCTVNCVHLVSSFDEWRGKQLLPDPNAPEVYPAIVRGTLRVQEENRPDVSRVKA